MYGGYDLPLVQIPQSVDYQQIVVSDTPQRDERLLVHEPRLHMHPRLAAKHAKCLPWEYSDADIIVWIDGSVRATDSLWLDWLIRESEGHLISQMIHPVRDDILDEADASAPMLKYQGQPVHAQANHYIQDGHPRNWGLWCTGLIVYRPHLDRDLLSQFGRHWLSEQIRWTYQDQISQPYVARKHGIRPNVLSGHIWDAPHFTLLAHTRED